MADDRIKSIPSESVTSQSVPLLSIPSPTESVVLTESLMSILDKKLEGLSSLMWFLGLSESKSYIAVTLHVFAVLLLCGVLPMSLLLGFRCSELMNEIILTIIHVGLAVLSIFCMARTFKRGGMQQFLTLDDDAMKEKYIEILGCRFWLLAVLLVPCLLLKVSQEVFRTCTLRLWWRLLIVGGVLSTMWAYSAATFLCACIIFRFVCEFQLARFGHIESRLSNEPESFLLLKEHLRMQGFISRINNFFQPFLAIMILLVVTSLPWCIWAMRQSSAILDVVSSFIAPVVGLLLCMRAAVQVSHRAQRVVSLASGWHALVMCADEVEAPLEGLEAGDIVMPTSGLPSYSEAWQRKFNAYMMYLERNNGGIHVYGLTVDSSFIYMLFGTCLSLALFVLSISLDWMAIRDHLLTFQPSCKLMGMLLESIKKSNQPGTQCG